MVTVPDVSNAPLIVKVPGNGYMPLSKSYIELMVIARFLGAAWEGAEPIVKKANMHSAIAVEKD